MDITIIQQLVAKSKDLGCRPGESAKAWRSRDPAAADKMAAWLEQNRPAVAKELSGAMVHQGGKS